MKGEPGTAMVRTFLQIEKQLLYSFLLHMQIVSSLDMLRDAMNVTQGQLAYNLDDEKIYVYVNNTWKSHSCTCENVNRRKRDMESIKVSLDDEIKQDKGDNKKNSSTSIWDNIKSWLGLRYEESDRR